MIVAKTRPEIIKSRPAPLKGMNTADMVTRLDNGFAQRIDNFVCRSDGLQVRSGYRLHDDAGSAVTALLPYKNDALFRTDGAWRSDVINNPGGQFLIACKSGAAPIVWDGDAWATCSISGVAPSSLVAPVAHGKRIFAIENGTLNIWYLPVESFGGEAKPIIAGMMSKFGGYGVALGSDGQRLYLVTSNGEMIIYKGLDPASPETWSFAGCYKVPVPVGNRCFATSATGVLFYAGATGLYNVSSMLKAIESNQEDTAVSAPIEPTYIASGASGVLISSSQDFLAVETSTGLLVRTSNGWSRLLGFDATCWTETANGLYFGKSNGSIYKLRGTEDIPGSDPVPIGSVLVDSFSGFATGGRKIFSRIRPQYKLTHPYKAKASLLMNYRTPSATWQAQYQSSRYWAWPEVDYPIMPAEWFKPQSERLGFWRGTAGNGETAALVLGISSVDGGATFIGCDYAFEAGGMF